MNQSTHKQNHHLKRVEFVKGVTGEDEILEESRPHIVLAGRSNAGKSSVLNTLAGRKIARVSGTPGKTQEINFFSVADAAYLVDLPGYGYAKMSAHRAEKLRKQMIWYLARSEAPIALLVLVADIRRGLGDLDRDLLDIASGEGLPTLILANKVDKCSQSQRVHGERQIQADTDSHPGIVQGLLAFSTKTGEGSEELCAIIEAIYAD